MYDYVIVGGGSAGCVLAGRLSEDPDARVLLLEAGGPNTQAEIHIPAAFSKLFQGDLDWNYHTVRQSGAADRALYWPRGKVLGGSSSINAMIYIRGHRAAYDGWAEGGCDGWAYDDVLPYFTRAEDNERGASEYHGAGGPLRVEDPRGASPISDAFVDAAVAAGHARNPDFNGAEQEGGRPLPAHPAPGPPRVGRRRLPQTGPPPAQPDRLDGRARTPDRDRGRPRSRRRGRARRRRRDRPR